MRDDQRRASVDSAEHEEVTRQRYDFLRRSPGPRAAVVCLDDQQVVAGGIDRRGGVEAEAGERALVLAQVVAVEPDIGDGADAVELQEVATACAGAGALNFNRYQPVPGTLLDCGERSMPSLPIRFQVWGTVTCSHPESSN